MPAVRHADPTYGKVRLLPAGRPVIFLGPSLPVTRVRLIIDADCCPPLRRGDLDAIAASEWAGLVDGVLEADARLSPGGARHAAERGIRLFGAASIGAVLAADPTIPGTVRGVGRVFRLLRRSRATADDVALLYAADDLRPLTLPVVDVLCWLEDGVAFGHIPPGDAEAALARFRASPMTDRVPVAAARLLRCGSASVLAGGGLAITSAKATDARVLLRVLHRLGGSPDGTKDKKERKRDAGLRPAPEMARGDLLQRSVPAPPTLPRG